MSTLLAFDQAAALDAELGGSGSRGVFGDLGLTGKLLARSDFFEAVARKSYGPWELAQRARRAEGVADAMVQHLAEPARQSKGEAAQGRHCCSLAACGSSGGSLFPVLRGQVWVGGLPCMHAGAMPPRRYGLQPQCVVLGSDAAEAQEVCAHSHAHVCVVCKLCDAPARRRRTRRMPPT